MSRTFHDSLSGLVNRTPDLGSIDQLDSRIRAVLVLETQLPHILIGILVAGSFQRKIFFTAIIILVLLGMLAHSMKFQALYGKITSSTIN